MTTAHAPRVAPPGSLVPVAEDVYAFVQPEGGWCLNNAGLVAGGGRSVLVDTAATESRTRRLREEVARIVPGGPDYVVNTHFHGDHTFGNGQFAPARWSWPTRGRGPTPRRRASACATCGRTWSGARPR